MGVPIEGQLSITAPVFARDELNGDHNEPHQGIYEQSEAQGFAIGTRLIYPSTGRVFRYGRAGGVALSKAYMTAAEANAANLLLEAQGTSGASQEIGDYEVSIDTFAITLTDNELAGGWLVVQDATGEGDIYHIIASESVSTTLHTLLFDSPLRTAWAAGTEISIVKSAWWDVVVLPANSPSAGDRPAGVPLIDVSINYWAWLQTGGPAPIYVDTGDTIVQGEPVGKPGTHDVAGAVGVVETDGTDLVWGICRMPGAEGEVAIVDLTLETC
jgi:hypothetical protein